MSSLQQSLAKAKLSGLPFSPPLPPGAPSDILFEEEAEDKSLDTEEADLLKPLPEHSGNMDDDSSSASSASSVGSTGTIRPNERKGRFAKGESESPTSASSSQSPYSPLPWTPHFSTSFNLTSPSHPLSYHTYYTPPSSPSSPLFILHHGAGASGLSFATCASYIRSLAPEVGILAPDCRRHGLTGPNTSFTGSHQEQGGKGDMALSALATDLESVISLLQEREGWTELPPLVLVGHSLGGAVVTEVAKRGKLGGRGKGILGFAVLDVVEGSAVEALSHINRYLAGRPEVFGGVEEGVEWYVRSRTIRNTAQARVSVPSYLKPVSGSEASSFTTSASASTSTTTSALPASTQSAIAAESIPTLHPSLLLSSSSPPKQPPQPRDHAQKYTWTTNLPSTSPFWPGWFEGLSSKFLSARGGKLLILAGTDRLDKELMVGQMQGKFQLSIFPDSGHFVQEDQPEKTAQTLVDFWRRNDGSLLKLPPKVGEGGFGVGRK